MISGFSGIVVVRCSLLYIHIIACYTYYSVLHISYEWLDIYVAVLPLWVGKASCICFIQMICSVGNFHLYEESPFYEKFVGVV